MTSRLISVMIKSNLQRYSIRPTFPHCSLMEDQRIDLAEPGYIFDYWKKHILIDPTIEEEKEHLIVISLDSRLKLIGHHIVTIGYSDECAVRIGETLRPVLVAGSSRFVMMHNHPSGNPSPSSADRVVTKKMHDACKLLDIHLVDHIVVGKLDFYSFREHGLID